jgi:hypothetical protein
MSDPKRWSEAGEAGEASELERELLLAGQSVKLPEGERRALWASIALSLPVTPPLTGPGTATMPRALSATVRAYLTKGALFLAAVGGLTVGATQLWPREPPASAAQGRRAKVAAAPVSAVVDRSPSVAEAVPSATPPVSAPVSGEAHPRSPTPSQLREESMAVLEARSALRAGNATRSLQLLQEMNVRFPRGALGQEREALSIEALAQAGQTATAKRRAAAFLRAHPQSPYSVDVRRVAER